MFRGKTPKLPVIGREIQVDWEKQDTPMVSRRILVTKSINGKTGSMHFRSMYGVNVTRINRSGMDLFADPNLVLQVGDRNGCRPAGRGGTCGPVYWATS